MRVRMDGESRVRSSDAKIPEGCAERRRRGRRSGRAEREDRRRGSADRTEEAEGGSSKRAEIPGGGNWGWV